MQFYSSEESLGTTTILAFFMGTEKQHYQNLGKTEVHSNSVIYGAVLKPQFHDAKNILYGY